MPYKFLELDSAYPPIHQKKEKEVSVKLLILLKFIDSNIPFPCFWVNRVFTLLNGIFGSFPQSKGVFSFIFRLKDAQLDMRGDHFQLFCSGPSKGHS